MNYKTLFILFFLSSRLSFGQNNIFSLEEIYQQQIPIIQDLATGSIYIDPARNIRGHSRYLTPSFENGEVIINGINYKGVLLSYDIYVEELLTLHPHFSKPISLNSGKIWAFTLADGSTFIHRSEPENKTLKRGYYQVIWEGDVQFLAKHIKIKRKEPGELTYPFRFDQETKYYLEIKGQMTPLKSTNQTLKAIGIEKKDVAKHLKKKRLGFKSNPVEFLQFVGQYYSFNVN